MNLMMNCICYLYRKNNKTIYQEMKNIFSDINNPDIKNIINYINQYEKCINEKDALFLLNMKIDYNKSKEECYNDVYNCIEKR